MLVASPMLEDVVSGMNLIQQIESEHAAEIEAKRKLPYFEPGDTVRVMVRITEGMRSRVQAYEGVVIARSGGGLNESFTVRKNSYGVGVERLFPVYSPAIEGVELVHRSKVRRAKLYFLRKLKGKSARLPENTGIRARKLSEVDRISKIEKKASDEADKQSASMSDSAIGEDRDNSDIPSGKPKPTGPQQDEKWPLPPPGVKGV